MATNIDGPRADNDYHNTAWNWYSSMVLKQQDEHLQPDEGRYGWQPARSMTRARVRASFYLWYIDGKRAETDEQGNQKTTDVTKYCVYV